MEEGLDFLMQVGRLKQVKRSGWVEHCVPNPESVADHSFRVAVMCMVLAANENLDKNKLIKMSLIHDLAESELGDIIAEKGNRTVVSSKDKTRVESQTMTKLLHDLDDSEEYQKLWQEYAQQSTKEAKFLKQVDKLEMAIQAFEYEQANPNINLDEFWINSEKHITNSYLKEIFQKLKRKRKA